MGFRSLSYLGIIKYGALTLSILSLIVAAGLMADPGLRKLENSVDSGAATGGLARAQGFEYTEISGGKPVYHISGEQMHDEHGKIGAMRISAMRVVMIAKPRVTVLRGSADQAWILTGDRAQITTPSKKLVLKGNVRGDLTNGGTMQSKRAIVDVQTGKIELKDGYVLNTLDRKERGIQTSLQFKKQEAS